MTSLKCNDIILPLDNKSNDQLNEKNNTKQKKSKLNTNNVTFNLVVKNSNDHSLQNPISEKSFNNQFIKITSKDNSLIKKELKIKKTLNFSPNVKSTTVNKDKNKNDIESILSNYEETEQGSVNKMNNNSNINNKNDNFFLKKNKKMYETPTVNNCKTVTFERQSDKKILKFPIFDDNLIFTNINKSYMHNEDNDDGSSSSEETIEAGKKYVFAELDEVSNLLRNNLLSGKSNQKLFRRRFIFDKTDKVDDIKDENHIQVNN